MLSHYLESLIWKAPGFAGLVNDEGNELEIHEYITNWKDVHVPKGGLLSGRSRSDSLYHPHTDMVLIANAEMGFRGHVRIGWKDTLKLIPKCEFYA